MVEDRFETHNLNWAFIANRNDTVAAFIRKLELATERERASVLLEAVHAIAGLHLQILFDRIQASDPIDAFYTHCEGAGSFICAHAKELTVREDELIRIERFTIAEISDWRARALEKHREAVLLDKPASDQHGDPVPNCTQEEVVEDRVDATSVDGRTNPVSLCVPQPQPTDQIKDDRLRQIVDFKKVWRERGCRVTDEMIAQKAGWKERSPVTWWKRNDPRSTPAVDSRIRKVLEERPDENPSYFPQSRKT